MRRPWIITHPHGTKKINTDQRQRDRVGEGKSLVGEIEQNPGSADATWTGQVEDLKRYRSYQDAVVLMEKQLNSIGKNSQDLQH